MGNPGQFEEEFPLDEIEEAVKNAPSPVALTQDVAEQTGAHPDTCRDKLRRLFDQGRIERRKTNRVTLWWIEEEEDDA